MKGSPLTRAALAAGVVTPVLYFGTQLVAAPFYPGYSFLSQVASDLGSDRAAYPTIFNTGAFFTGIVTLFAAYGFFKTLKELGMASVWVWLTAIALVSCGVASINASYFHLPNPRHNPGLLGVGMFLLPFVLPFATWKLADARWLKNYLVGNIVFIAALAPVMGGAAGIDTHAYQGLLQRIFATTLFIPIGLVSLFLLGRARATQPAMA